ncbi:type I restriction endonuclease subunit R, EcoR124 family, partial [Staphylococcus aureus]
ERYHLSDDDVENLKTVKMPADRRIQDYRSTYNDIRDWIRREKANAEQVASSIDWGDVVFEVDLLKSQEINLDYILELILEHYKKTKT